MITVYNKTIKYRIAWSFDFSLRLEYLYGRNDVWGNKESCSVCKTKSN